MSGRVLVTGASGFVGAALVPALNRAGYTVRAATRHPGAAEGEPEVVAVPDLSQTVDWASLLEGVDAVVHLAGIAHVGPGVDPAAYDRVNRAATADLAAASAQARVRRFVFVSSIRAQSGAVAAHPLRETDPPRPTEAYGRSKLEAETAVRASDVAWTILRPAMVYGPGVKGNLAQLMRVTDSPWPLPFARLENRRSLLGLDNLIAAILFVLATEACERETYLVADPEPLAFAEIVGALRAGAGRSARLVPVPPALIAGGLKAIGRADAWDRLGGSLVVDASKLIAAGWHPDSDTRAGLARLAQAAKSRR